MADPLIDGELASGEFKRQQSRFRDWIGGGAPPGADATLPAVAGRYHLYVSLACPWCHRTVIVRELAGLTEALGISYLAPFRDERGWAFTGDHFDVPAVGGEEAWGDEYVDRVNSWELISEAYRLSDHDFGGRITVPVIWDTETERIVNNESGDIVRMLGSPESLGGLGDAASLELYPPALRGEIDALNERVYETINNGVYRADDELNPKKIIPVGPGYDWSEPDGRD